MDIKLSFITLAALLAAAAAGAQGNTTGRIMGTPLQSDDLNRIEPYPSSEQPTSIMDETLRLTVNKDQDRVGANYEVCNDPQHLSCGNVTFVFPQLKVDRESKAVMLGDTRVGHYGSAGNVRLENGYELRSEIAQGETDSGFDRRPSRHIKVFLNKKGE